MATGTNNSQNIPIGRVFLWENNPRHTPLTSQPNIIARLCEKEDVLPLARDIAKNGLNPLERFAVLPVQGKRAGLQNTSYYVAEGNRRLCALKLLNDPDLAPAKFRRSFEKLSDAALVSIKTVSVVVFDNEEEVRLWLDRTHNGPQGGIGRKSWNAEQKARHDGDNKNKAAQELLDYAEAEKMLTPEERAGKLTTVQRFLSNDVFREILGFDPTDPDNVGRMRPKDEFDLILKRFIRDLVKKEDVHSRMNKQDIVKYARPLASMPRITAARVETEALSANPNKVIAKRSPKSQLRAPVKAKHVRYEHEIAAALKIFNNDKLNSLYHSICSVDLDPHTPLIAVGMWSFFETLTACAGRNSGTSFASFLSKNKLISYGVSPDHVATLQGIMIRIGEYGNTTKHHPTAAAFNGDQLNNDMIAMKDVILKCIEGENEPGAKNTGRANAPLLKSH